MFGSSADWQTVRRKGVMTDNRRRSLGQEVLGSAIIGPPLTWLVGLLLSDTHAGRCGDSHVRLHRLLTLALGIGTNTAIFSVVKAVVLNPLPYEDPERLVVLWEVNPDGALDRVSIPTFEDWKT